ncbi:ABC transporter permease [Candidatus Micrarchaeota archaeon]|nr:ABC transporter permease [Candidatus Micrarchaeota archaeon]
MYRDLFMMLVWRDILVRYKQTVLGAAWAILQPLTAMLIFTVIFGRLAKIPSDELPYPIFAYSGLLIWTYFSQTLTQASNSLIQNERLVTKIYFPRILMPTAPIAAGLLDMAIGSVLLLFLLPYFGVSLSPNIWAAPIMIALAAISSMSAGILISALNVKYRDFRHVLPFLVQIWMYASPVVYPASLIPEKWRLLFAVNPMVGAVHGFRWALLGTDVNPWPLIAVSSVSALIILLFALIYFSRSEEYFADLI